jgi:type II secretory pathway pseudopilin PulG
MKIQIANDELRMANGRKRIRCSRGNALNSKFEIRNSKWVSAFTMMEIAISLAVIGIALVAIIGLLPLGLRVQKENREKTLINQDATVFMEMIRAGMNTNSPQQTDLTNYVFAITNYWYFTNAANQKSSSGVDGFDYYGSDVSRMSPAPIFPLTNNYCILGLMSMPEYTDGDGKPLPTLIADAQDGCYSNHIVAYVHSMSGLAANEPPQGNQLLRDSSFGYRVLCENLPPAFPLQEWTSQAIYTNDNTGGDRVYYIDNGTVTYWHALHNTKINQNLTPPDNPDFWAHDGYTQTMANSTHNLRLTFLWPLLPNNNLPPMPGRQTYRTQVTGELVQTNITMEPRIFLYFFQPQMFTNAP